ncbi:3'-5' exonuclease [Sediminibacillus massiliensis]|uniref:3'-5' exonuclease n=1 Tax=Sediminibacillus massiliensis TaxID=1926277 RepID=UPI000988575F|nr:3'-5' exonuclease [Sediminibacillus massiliensis]
MNIVSIDFETANSVRYSPCSIGIVVANEHEIIEEYYSLINPLMEFSPYNTYIHGIREVDVEDAPTFDQLWPVIRGYLENNLVVAHNASFDMSVLRATLDRYEIEYPELEYLCTVNISKKVWPDLFNHKLNTVASHNNIEFNHHDALEDARVAALILMAALKEQQAESMEGLKEKYGLTCGRIFERGYVAPKTKPAQRKRRKTRQFHD